MFLQSRGAGFLHQSFAAQGLSLTLCLRRPSSINLEVSLLATARYGIVQQLV